MKINTTIAALVLASLCAGAQDLGDPTDPKDPRPLLPTGPDPTVPETSDAKKALQGEWILDNTSLAKAMTDALKAGSGGTKFVLDDIRGDYVAKISLDTMKLAVDWRKWEMRGTAHTRRAGSFPVLLRITGRQTYKIDFVTEGKSLKDRQMSVALKSDAATASVFFRGVSATGVKMDIPKLATGSYSVNINTFHLVNSGYTWKFTRAKTR